MASAQTLFSYPHAPMHSKVPVLEAAIAMKMMTTVAATRTTGPICVSGPISQCPYSMASYYPSSWSPTHQYCSRCGAGGGLKNCFLLAGRMGFLSSLQIWAHDAAFAFVKICKWLLFLLLGCFFCSTLLLSHLSSLLINWSVEQIYYRRLHDDISFLLLAC